MLYQLQQLLPSGKRNLISQVEFPNNSLASLADWEDSVKARHPLPEGANWVLCTEKSRNFLDTGSGDLPGQKHFEFDET